MFPPPSVSQPGCGDLLRGESVVETSATPGSRVPGHSVRTVTVLLLIEVSEEINKLHYIDIIDSNAKICPLTYSPPESETLFSCKLNFRKYIYIFWRVFETYGIPKYIIMNESHESVLKQQYL